MWHVFYYQNNYFISDVNKQLLLSEIIIIVPDSPRINIIKKDDFDCDSACNSHVINSEIDTESKIKVEDDFNYDTTGILN